MKFIKNFKTFEQAPTTTTENPKDFNTVKDLFIETLKTYKESIKNKLKIDENTYQLYFYLSVGILLRERQYDTEENTLRKYTSKAIDDEETLDTMTDAFKKGVNVVKKGVNLIPTVKVEEEDSTSTSYTNIKPEKMPADPGFGFNLKNIYTPKYCALATITKIHEMAEKITIVKNGKLKCDILLTCWNQGSAYYERFYTNRYNSKTGEIKLDGYKTDSYAVEVYNLLKKEKLDLLTFLEQNKNK